MAALPTIPQVIQRGQVSIYLAGNDVAKGSLFGKRLASPVSPIEIMMSVDALSWQYVGDPTDTTLRGFANYVIWECGGYGLQAQNIISGSAGGGTVLPPGGTRGNYFVIIAEATSTDPGDGSLVIGSFVYTDTRLVGGTQLAYIIVNSSIETIASGLVSFDAETGTITRLSAWQSGDTVQIPFVMA